MKEDILEQLVDDYLQHQGYFTLHNIKFRPNKDSIDFDIQKDSVHSDIDVMGLNPNKSGCERVKVVTCKSWQFGFTPAQYLSALEKGDDYKYVSRPVWKSFRELTKPKWSLAFNNKIKEITGSTEFTYVLAVTKLNGNKEIWENYPRFKNAINGNLIQIITVKDILDTLFPMIRTTVASTEIGRLLQVLKASGWLH
jgi:hypothetical protein